MRCIAIFVLGIFSLFGIDIPQEGGLHGMTLDNKVLVWTCKNAVPPEDASFRVVWKSKGKATICSADIPTSETDEMLSFFEMCREKIDPLAERVAVIAVGDFSEEEMMQSISARFSRELSPKGASDMPRIAIATTPSIKHVEVGLNFPTLLSRLDTVADLKRQWICYFLQNLVQRRLQASLKDTSGLEIPVEESSFLLPGSYCSARAKATIDNCLIVLAGYLVGIQEMRQTGFSDAEFSSIRAKAQKALLAGYRRVPDSSTLASYFADQFSLGLGCPSYNFYMTTSLNLIPEITIHDVNQMLSEMIKDNHKRVELLGPEEMAVDELQVETVLNDFEADIFSMVRQNQNEIDLIADTADSYTQLPMTEEEAEIIWKIVDTMANNNPIMLGFKKGDLEKKGAKIRHVHPLRFLGAVFSNPYLKKCMVEIRDSIFKWGGFMDGLGERLDQEYKRGNLSKYISGFSQTVRANPDQVRVFVQKQDWRGLVEYLMKLD